LIYVKEGEGIVRNMKFTKVSTK